MGQQTYRKLVMKPAISSGSCSHCRGQASKNQSPRTGYGLVKATLDAIELTPEAHAIIREVLDLRRNTRPGYPPRAMLRAFGIKFLLNEPFNVGLIQRLNESAKLRQLCGFNSEIPSESAFSRFFKKLSDRVDLLEQSITSIVNHLHEHLPDIGDITTIDSTDIEAYANPRRSAVIDQDAKWGHRTAKNKSASKKNDEMFFSYKLHLMGDAVYGVPLNYILLPANRGDSPQLPRLVKEALQTYSWLKPSYLLADRGYDALSNHETLVQEGIKPIIHIRKAVKAKLHYGLYTTMGEPVCTGKKVMQWLSTDPKTGHHLYGCPPAGCHRKSQAYMFMSNCGDQHWEKPEDDLRVISTVARASPEWKLLYRKRPIIERGFSSLKRSRLLDKHQYLTKRKIRTHAALSVLTYVSTMLAHVLAGDVERIRRMRV